MGNLPELSQIPIEPAFVQVAPNRTIELGTFAVRLEHNGVSFDTVAKVAMRFLPETRLEFVCPLEGLPPRYTLGLVASTSYDFRIALSGNGVSFDALFSQTRENEIVLIPAASGVTVSKPSDEISSAKFHIFNFPEFVGPGDFVLATKTPAAQHWHRCGRVELRADGWAVTISAIDQTDALSKGLRENGGLVITHVAEVARDDGSAFSSAQLSDLLGCLHYFLSFALGRWAGVVLPVGYDAAGKKVFEEWGFRTEADGYWSGSNSWFDEHHSELLSEVFPGFRALWVSDDWRTPLMHALYWYLGSCDRGVGVGVDTGVILAQTALELLAWTYCVVDRKMVSRAAFRRGGLAATDKLRLLASSLGIPSALPSAIAGMNPKSGKQWNDSFDAITAIRNGLVHPDAAAPLASKLYYEGWRLSLWYVDLVLLRMCGHVGKYANRLATRWKGTVESVPWA